MAETKDNQSDVIGALPPVGPAIDGELLEFVRALARDVARRDAARVAAIASIDAENEPTRTPCPTDHRP